MVKNKSNLQDYISKRIRLLRIERGYTQEQLEEMADLGTNYVYKLENLSTNLKIQTLEKVMEALEVDLDTFFDIQLKEEDPKISRLIDELKLLPAEQRSRVLDALLLILKEVQ
ncbi:helix-turn-helix transcriptional regulator [Streptococcus infantis]|uniref:helix-turn-helix domain-containing protein n=1 Tax=Streptococcus infantis TaxID=68892 RepID=UPI0039C0702D